MNNVKFFFAATLIFALCSAFAEDSNQDPEIECLKLLADKPGLAVLKGKIQFGTFTEPTLEMMASVKKPTQKEKAAISLLVSSSETCIHQGDDWRAINWPPGVISLFDEHAFALKVTIAELYAGTISYGDFVKRAASANAKFKADLAAFAEKMRAKQSAKFQTELQQQQQLAQEEERRKREQSFRDAEMQQRNAELAFQQEQSRRAAVLQVFNSQQALQQQAQQNRYQQQMDALRSAMPQAPVKTDCYTIGHSTNCTSSR